MRIIASWRIQSRRSHAMARSALRKDDRSIRSRSCGKCLFPFATGPPAG
jgi:hypothetical protein